MHGFLSRDGFPPLDLLAVGREEVAAYGGRIVHDTVTRIDDEGQAGFRVVLRDDGPVLARRLLVATGLRDELPAVAGLRERWARDVLHCPYCHGYEVRDTTLGVLGWSPQAEDYAQIVRQWSEDVVYLATAETLPTFAYERLTARGIAVVEGSVQRVLVLDDRLVGVELTDSRKVSLDALFVPPRFASNNELLIDLGCEHDEAGWPITHGDGRTSVAGVWVAGNAVNPRAQVITAAGEGAAAAIAINADLVQEDVRDAVDGAVAVTRDQ
jgi:thioredoxin reductase